jgi:uncharacterized membrane protein
MLDIVQLAAGLYLIWSAAWGKGKVYENEYIKVPRERYVKTIRILCAITGPLLTASAGLGMAKVIEPGKTTGWISWAVCMAALVALAVYTSVSTDKEAAKAAQQATVQQAKADSLRAAFVFDDEDDADQSPADGK